MEILSTADLKPFLDAAPDALVIVNSASRIVAVNDAADRLFGYAPGELRAAPLSRLVPESARAAHEHHVADFHATPRHRRMGRGQDLEARRKDGSTFPAEISLRPIEVDGRHFVVSAIRDVTEERRRREELRQNRARWRRLVERNRDPILVVIEGRIAYVNPAGAQVLGGEKPGDIVGESIFAFKDPGQGRAQLRARLRCVYRGEATDPLEHTITRLDGATRIVETYSMPIEYNGQPAAQMVMHDRTERRAAEERLRQSEVRYRTLVEAAPEAIVVADPETGHLVDVNQAACDFFGRPREALIGLHQRALHPEDLAEAAVQEFETFVATARKQKTARVEAFPVRRVGREDGLADVTGRLTKLDGRPVVFAFFQDVTERVRRQRELRIHRQHLQDAQRIAHLGHWVWDMPSGTLEWSDEVYRIFGVDPDHFEPTFERFLERVHPDDRQHIRREVESDTYQIEHRVVRPDGEVRIVEERGQITRWDGGEPAEMTGTVLDVTERARLERQLRQAQKMEMVGTLAGGVAHDFNNILHAVGAYVHLAQDSLPDGAAEQAFLSRVDRGLERARKLVDQLMTFSRQEGPADKTAVSIADEVREVVDLVRPTLPSDTDLRVKLDEGPPVWGDPDQLQQVVMNLLTNAAHALGEMDAQARRVLDVKVCPIVVDEELAARHVNLTPGTYVRTTVSDTGGGIDAATQERIFDPFFTTKGVGEGTGLGLSVVHGIVRRHGGSVTVYSEPGEGTTFHVYVPAMEEEASAELAPPAPEPEALSVEGVRLLVVDDNPDIVDVEAERLRHMGCRVTPCLGPDAALEELRRAPDAFDAVLTDYTMPHMNGLELIAALRKMRPGLPALLFSGFSAQVDAADLRAAGVDAFLHKPVPQKDLRQALHALVTPQADRLAD